MPPHTAPPMIYFTRSYKQGAVKRDQILDIIASECVVTRHIFDDFFYERDLAPHVFAYGLKERKAAAMTLSNWATTQLFTMPFYQPEARDYLKNLPFKDRMTCILDGLYKVLIMARLYAPSSPQDHIIRAILDNRISGLKCNENDSAICQIATEPTRHVINTKPEIETDIYEVIFAQSAAIFAADYKGHFLFLNGRRLAPPAHVLATAIERIIAACSMAKTLENLCTATKTDLETITPNLRQAISVIHTQDPLTLACPMRIKNMGLKEIKEKILEPAVEAMKQSKA